MAISFDEKVLELRNARNRPVDLILDPIYEKYDNRKHLTVDEVHLLKQAEEAKAKAKIIEIRRGLLNENIMLTGGAGTGKTTIIQGVISELSKEIRIAGGNPAGKIKLVALTGQATIVAQEGLYIHGIEARTINSAFNIGPTVFDRHFSIDEYAPSTPLPPWMTSCDYLVIDEISLVQKDLLT